MISTTHTEEFIMKLYNHMGILKPERLDSLKIAMNLGISVYHWPDNSQALFLKDQSYIFLNEQLTQQQQWQDFCHELGHILLHTGNQRRMSPLFREYQEYKANNFMYHACMPTFMLDELQLCDYLPQTVVKLQELFNVEYEFAMKRLTQYLNKRSYVPYWNSRKC